MNRLMAVGWWLSVWMATCAQAAPAEGMRLWTEAGGNTFRAKITGFEQASFSVSRRGEAMLVNGAPYTVLDAERRRLVDAVLKTEGIENVRDALSQSEQRRDFDYLKAVFQTDDGRQRKLALELLAGAADNSGDYRLAADEALEWFARRDREQRAGESTPASSDPSGQTQSDVAALEQRLSEEKDRVARLKAQEESLRRRLAYRDHDWRRRQYRDDRDWNDWRRRQRARERERALDRERRDLARREAELKKRQRAEEEAHRKAEQKSKSKKDPPKKDPPRKKNKPDNKKKDPPKKDSPAKDSPKKDPPKKGKKGDSKPERERQS